jgi:signal transduction histidine kinase
MTFERIPERENQRLAAIDRYEILDSPREETFDRIVSIACAVFGTHLAAITLVDRERSWHMSEIGMGPEMLRADEMCDRVISQDDVLVINDARLSPPDAVLPMLKFGVRFYAGAPLRTYDGVKIGTICTIDPEPHEVTQQQRQVLHDLASIIIDEMELRLAARKMSQVDAELRSINHQLEMVSRNKSEFLASMSHELRTPLNGILGASELLGQGLFGEMNEKQHEYVGDIHQSGTHLLRLIEDVLDLSRIEAGQMPLHRELIDASALMHASGAMVRALASARSVDLRIELPSGELLLYIDERRIIQVACNLLSNALKFTPAGGCVKFKAWRESEHAVFAVEDEGPGIPPELHDKIFEQFFRAATDQEGTGLGLPVARQLVELHEGRIWVESEPGKGARFLFALRLQTSTG